MSFLQGSIDFFKGQRSSHMGSYQYIDHAGKRGGQSMSGAKLWAEIEASELACDDKNMFSAEERLLLDVSRGIGDYFPHASPVLEMGTGTPNAFKKKTLLIMMALRGIDYICVDESQAFLDALVSNPALARFNVHPICGDFFEAHGLYYDKTDRDVLICMFGSTIGNIVAPLSTEKPRAALIEHLRLMANSIMRGGLLVSFDANHEGEGICAFYTKQASFQLNTYYRMKEELPITGDFDPDAFSYEATWTASSGQLAHMAVVDRNMDFVLGAEPIHLSKGQRLHMKNSFKFSHDFFTDCARAAGLEVKRLWVDDTQTSVCLLKKA